MITLDFWLHYILWKSRASTAAHCSKTATIYYISDTTDMTKFQVPFGNP